MLAIFQTVIGILTLAFAFAGFVNNLYGSKYSIDINQPSVGENRSLWLLQFTIINRSLKPIKIDSIHFFTHGREVSIRPFDPQNFDMAQDEMERQAQERKQERKNESNDLPFNTFHSIVEPLPNHPLYEYSYYNPLETPFVVHGDHEQEVSYYFSTKPDHCLIIFDRKLILSFKFFISPVFSSSISFTPKSDPKI